MSLTKGTNSYATVEEADVYFADRLGTTAWTAASPFKKAQALITASTMLETLNWLGEAESADQPMSFPRVGEYFDPKVGSVVEMEGIPGRVSVASMDLALHILTDESVLASGGNVRNLTVGSISLEFVQKAPKMPQHVRVTLSPLLENGGRRLWWRAN